MLCRVLQEVPEIEIKVIIPRGGLIGRLAGVQEIVIKHGGGLISGSAGLQEVVGWVGVHIEEIERKWEVDPLILKLPHHLLRSGK